MWSVFEQTDLKEWRSSSLETSDYVSALFLIYLVFFRHHVGEYADRFADKNVRQYHGEPIIT